MATTYPLPAYPKGNTWIGTYNNATQCMGFAYMIFDNTCGLDNCTNITKRTFKTNAECQTAISGIRVGAMVNFTWKSGASYSGNHSIIVAGKSTSGITVYDCNFSGANLIDYRQWTWDNIISRFDTISGGKNPK